MAQIKLFQGGEIQRDAPEVSPFRAPDFGPGIGPGIEKLGQALGETAQKVNEIQDIHARIEANRLSVAYNNLAVNIQHRVRSTLGENAEAAAAKGVTDLQTGTQELLAQASPRARTMLAPEFAKRTADAGEQFWTYGFEQKKQAYDTSSQAANDADLETALKQSTDEAAQPYLNSIRARNAQRSTFFGYGKDWEDQENSKAISGFYRGRALAIGQDSAHDAIQYAIAHRGEMGDQDFESVVKSFRAEALDEQATTYITGHSGSDPTTLTSPPAEDGTPTRKADPAMVFNALELPNEGSRMVIDSNGHPVRYGINQGYNPDIDVSKLTLAGAQRLFTERVWNKSGADKLAPALAVVHADTFFLNEKEAGKILKESDGDVQKYMELRENFLARLHAENPAKYPDYTSRNRRVEAYAASVGGNGTPLSFTGKITADTSMSQVTDEVMARTDMPMALKTAIINKAREWRGSLREDKRIEEDDARDSLITQVTKLGDDFTSIKQLSGDELAKASPETINSLTKAARTNRYKKDDQSLIPEINFTEVTDPQKFMSGQFVQHLMSKGASPQLITKVLTQQGEIAKKAMNAKPDVISDGTLWKIAKPAFIASGIPDLDDRKKNTNIQANAQEKMQAVGFLRELATEWATDNPGKRPTAETMQQWVGAALLNSHGRRLFQMGDQELVNSLAAPVRDRIVRALRNGGDNAQGAQLTAHIASFYHKIKADYGNVGRRLDGVETNGVPGLDGGIDMGDADYGDDQ